MRVTHAIDNIYKLIKFFELIKYKDLQFLVPILNLLSQYLFPGSSKCNEM